MCKACDEMERLKLQFLSLSPSGLRNAEQIHVEARSLYFLPDRIPDTGPVEEVKRQLALRMRIAKMLRGREPIVCPGECMSTSTTQRPS